MQRTYGRLWLRVAEYVRRYSKAAPKKEVGNRRVFKVYRYGGIKSKEEPKMQTIEFDISTCGPMVLDVLMKMKDMDPSLTFRRSCREGICGSCAICMQGCNYLACVTPIPKDKTITIHPLPHMYVQRDLVVDLEHFFQQYASIKPYIIRHTPGNGSNQLAQSIRDNLKTIGLYECVLCACCSTSCPSYWWNGRRFLGPATLMAAYRWIIDSRDDGAAERLNFLRDDFKAFRCHTILSCTFACPRGLNPGLAIARLKRMISGIDKKETPDLSPMLFHGGGGGGGSLEACIKKIDKKCESKK